jgi:hypothetical protein
MATFDSGRQRYHQRPLQRRSYTGRPSRPAEGQLRVKLRPRPACPVYPKSPFLGDEENFLGPLMRFVCGDVRDLIVSRKNDHGPSHRRYSALQR